MENGAISVEIIAERLQALREELRTLGIRVEVVLNTQTELQSSRTSLERDVVELRQEVQKTRLDHAENARTIAGIGASLDAMRKAGDIEKASFASEIRLLKWLVGFVAATLTTVVGEYVLRLFGLS